MTIKTPASRWHELGEEDPHLGKYDCERHELPLGNLTDDELANEVYLNGDTNPTFGQIMSGEAKPTIVYLTAAKERIRWLSRKLIEAEKRLAELESDSIELSEIDFKVIDAFLGCNSSNSLDIIAKELDTLLQKHTVDAYVNTLGVIKYIRDRGVSNGYFDYTEEMVSTWVSIGDVNITNSLIQNVYEYLNKEYGKLLTIELA